MMQHDLAQYHRALSWTAACRCPPSARRSGPRRRGQRRSSEPPPKRPRPAMI